MMTLLTTARGAARLTDRIAWAMSAAATALNATAKRRDTYLSLSTLDDRTLHDIGLNRSMLMSVAVHGVRSPRDAEPFAKIADAYGGRKPSALTWVRRLISDVRARLANPELRDLETCLGPDQLKEISSRTR
jgi:uncharacterized protein YjiS (DUF1127 family)